MAEGQKEEEEKGQLGFEIRGHDSDGRVVVGAGWRRVETAHPP